MGKIKEIYNGNIVKHYDLTISHMFMKYKKQAFVNTLLKKGDKVTTTGGIYGKINDVKDRTVTLEIADNVLVKVDKTAVTAEPAEQAPSK